MSTVRDRKQAANRARRALKHQLDVVGVPQTHLDTIAQAMLEDHFNQREVRVACEQAAREAVDREWEIHRADLKAQRARHENELADVRAWAQEAHDRGVAAGKHGMQAKHRQLTDAVETLRDALDFVDAARAWSGREDWREETISRLDDLINRTRPTEADR